MTSEILERGGFTVSASVAAFNAAVDARIGLQVDVVTVASKAALAAVNPSGLNTGIIADPANGPSIYAAVDPASYSALAAVDTTGDNLIATPNASLSWLRLRPRGNLFKHSEFGSGAQGVLNAVGAAGLHGQANVVELDVPGEFTMTKGLLLPRHTGLQGVGSSHVRMHFGGVSMANLNENTTAIMKSGDAFVALPAFTSTIDKHAYSMTFASAQTISVTRFQHGFLPTTASFLLSREPWAFVMKSPKPR